MSSVLSKLGNAVNVSSAPSCHGEGEDKTYEYNGFTIYTYPSGGNDLVLEINVQSSAVPTSKGVKTGSSLNDVTAVYGKGYTTDGNYVIYSSGVKTLQFFMSGNTVSEIDYYYNV
jgi:Zn/Cd-binding protein ZinT